jgi:hypothetical protein
MGRPKLNPAECRSVRFFVSFLPAEAQALNSLASKAGKKLKDWVRDVLLSVATKEASVQDNALQTG